MAVFTDASEEFCAGVLNKNSKADMSIKIQEQKYEPLAFLRGQFIGAQQNWPTFEKETYGGINVFERIDHVLLGPKPCLLVHRAPYTLLFVHAVRPTPKLSKIRISKITPLGNTFFTVRLRD